MWQASLVGMQKTVAPPGTPERGWMTGALSLPLESGETGEQVHLHYSIISNFMIYQDRPERSLLQLFAHTYNSEWFSIISIIIFEVNFVAEHMNAKRMTIISRVSMQSGPHGKVYIYKS